MSGRTVVIIGGGMAGLTSAAYLTKAGFSVRVFEQHVLPGGYVSSFIRNGFVFPAGPTSFGSNGIIFPILYELGLDKQIKFVRAKHQISWGVHDIPFLTPSQTKRELKACFPQEKDALNRYFRWVEVGARAFHDSLKGGMMFGRGILKTILKQGLKHPLSTWAFWVAGRHTNQSLHDSYFTNSTLRQLLNRLGYPVMAGKNTLGMWASYFYDTWVPVGGMQVLANTLTRFIHDNGGKVSFGKNVTQIRIEDGQACGVELQNEGFIHADWVVSAADLNQTCFHLIGRDNLPESMTLKLENARPSESIFAVYLGLDGSAQLSTALRRFHESHVYFTCSDGTYIQLVLLSKDDPSVAPVGKHALYIASLSPFEHWEGIKHNQLVYQAQKEAYTEELITRAEEFISGLRAHIVVRDSATPLTFERYTSNWRASTSGWNWDPQDAPRFDFDKDLCIKNFYPVGHYVHNPGGVPTAMITAWYIAQSITNQTTNLSN